MIRLSPVQIAQALQTVKGWRLSDGKLAKEFKFANFPTAVVFVDKLVDPAEELNHHPAVTINYNRVVVTLFSHAANAITDRDFELAKRIDALAPQG